MILRSRLLPRLLLFLFSAQLATSADILFLNSWHSKSHLLTMSPLAEKLVQRGHNVTMYSMASAPIGGPKNGVHYLESVVPQDKLFLEKDLVSFLFWNAEMAPEMISTPYQIGRQYVETLQTDEIFLRLLETKFDLVIMDEMFLSQQAVIAYRLRERFGTKFVILFTTDLYFYAAAQNGFHRNPVVSPDYYSKGYSMFNWDNGDFWTRWHNMRDYIIDYYTYSGKVSDEIRQSPELLGIADLDMEKVQKDSLGITFIDLPRRYGHATSRSQNLIYTGEHCPPSKPLPEDLRAFVEDPSSKGTIYIGFGSIVNWTTSPEHVVTSFVTALNQFTDYRVIWSYAGKEIPNLGQHIRLLAWAPQNDILNHNKTILYFTHGGLKSLREGICSATALLFLPFFADQPRNALSAMSMGIAEAIYKKNISAEEVTTKMRRVLVDDTFQRKIKELSSTFLDNVVPALDEGAFWVERSLHLDPKQFKFYRIKGVGIGFFDFLYVYSILAIICLLFVVSK